MGRAHCAPLRRLRACPRVCRIEAVGTEDPRARKVSVVEEPGTQDEGAGGVPRTIPERFANRILMTVPARHDPKLARILELGNADDELYALGLAASGNGIDRLGLTAHGPVHGKIGVGIAAKLPRRP